MGLLDRVRRRELKNRVDDDAAAALMAAEIEMPAGMGVSSQGRVDRAKAMEGSKADGAIAVQLLDEEGNPTGDIFDAFAFADQSATDMTNYLPTISEGETIFVKQIQREWYLDWTPILKGTSASSLTTVVDMTGAVLSSIGKW